MDRRPRYLRRGRIHDSIVLVEDMEKFRDAETDTVD